MNQRINHLLDTPLQVTETLPIENWTQLISYGIGWSNNILRMWLGKDREKFKLGVGVPILNILNKGNNTWFPAEYLPNPENKKFKALTATNGSNNNTQLILIAENGLPYLIWQDHLMGTWSWYGQLPLNTDQTFKWVTSMRGNSSNAQVILLGEDGHPYLIYQDNNNGKWIWFGKLPLDKVQNYKMVQLGVGNSSRLQALLIGADGLPYLIWQDNNGNWHWYGELPIGDFNGTFNEVQVFSGNNNNLQAVFLDKNGIPYLIFQDYNNGKWHWFGKLPLGAYEGKITYFTIEYNNNPNDTKYNVYLYSILSDGSQKVYRIELNGAGTWTWKGIV